MLGVHRDLEIGRAELPLRIERHFRQLRIGIAFGRSSGCPDDHHVDIARTDWISAFNRRTGGIDGPRRHAARGEFVADRLSPRHRGFVRHERHRRGPAFDVANAAMIPQKREDIFVVVVSRRHRRMRADVLRGHEEKNDRKRDGDARSHQRVCIVYRLP